MHLNRASAGSQQQLAPSESGNARACWLRLLAAPAGYAVGGGLDLSDVGPGVSYPALA